MYENTAAGLAAERYNLEREASAVQEDALREETRFHMLHMQMESLALVAERAREEAAYEKGEGRYMRDFRTVKDLFAQKHGQVCILLRSNKSISFPSRVFRPPHAYYYLVYTARDAREGVAQETARH